MKPSADTPAVQSVDDQVAIEAKIADLEAQLALLRAPKKIEFPKTMFKHDPSADPKAERHAVETCIVKSQEELDALEGSWSETSDPKATAKPVDEKPAHKAPKGF